MDKFMDKLIGVSAKLASNKVLNIIQSAFMLMMPISMIGGFAALFNGIGVEAYQAFITSVGIKSILSVIYQWTIGMIAVYLAFLVAYRFAETYKCAKSNIAVGLISLVCFLIVTPFVVPEDPYGAEAVYTVVLSNPDPDAEKKPEEPEAVSEEEEAEETEDALPEKDVTIEMERFEGNEIRLFAKNADAEENENLVYQWQFSLDNEHWVDVEGANAREYTFTLDDTTSNSYWRLCVSEKASEEEAEGTSEEAAFEDIADPQPQDS